MEINGEFRLRMASAPGQLDLRKIHPDWFVKAPDGWWRPRFEAREDVLDRVTESDTGVVKNIVTDALRLYLFASAINVFAGDLFIHESTMSGNQHRNIVQFVYGDQTPSQVRNPDVQTFLQSTQTQVRSVQFPPPNVQREIASVGITNQTTVSGVTASNSLAGIFAYQKLSTPQTQTVVLAADLLYNLAFSFN